MDEKDKASEAMTLGANCVNAATVVVEQKGEADELVLQKKNGALSVLYAVRVNASAVMVNANEPP